MKKLLLILLVLFPAISFAAVGIYDNGTYRGEASSINIVGTGDSFDGTKYTINVMSLSGDTSVSGEVTATRTTVAVTVPDGAVTGDYQYAVGAADIPAGVIGYLKNTGSTAATTGHAIGVWGHAEDTTGGKHMLIGTEGKVTAASTANANAYYGVVGFSRWYGSGTPAVGTVVAGGYFKTENAASEGGAAKNNVNVYGFYVDNGVGGQNAFGLYVAPLTQGTNNIGAAIGAASSYTLWLSANTDSTAAAGGITFGVSGDTNLYRGGANVLKTDDAFIAGAGLYAAGGSANKATCWKSDGVGLGYCSSVVAADGGCTCN